MTEEYKAPLVISDQQLILRPVETLASAHLYHCRVTSQDLAIGVILCSARCLNHVIGTEQRLVCFGGRISRNRAQAPCVTTNHVLFFKAKLLGNS
jgi:hypothetical protein